MPEPDTSPSRSPESERGVLELSFVEIANRRIGILSFDDGKHNIITQQRAVDLVAELKNADAADALVLAGGARAFSAGLDLEVIQSGDGVAIAGLLNALGRAAIALWTHPKPTVAAVTGHSIAGGAALSLACDVVVCGDGMKAKWGLPELSLGMVPPSFVVELAAARMRGVDLLSLLLSGTLVDCERAANVGLVDYLVEDDAVMSRALERAGQLAAIPSAAYAATKQRLRGDRAAALLGNLSTDIDQVLTASELKVQS